MVSRSFIFFLSQRFFCTLHSLQARYCNSDNCQGHALRAVDDIIFSLLFPFAIARRSIFSNVAPSVAQDKKHRIDGDVTDIIHLFRCAYTLCLDGDELN